MLACSIARVTQYAAATSNSTRKASGLSNRKISTAAGVSARTAPASRPAAEPATRRTVAASSATAATPSSACGTSRLQLLYPNSRADSPMIHKAPGGLSTVMKFEESSEPKNQAFQLFAPACTAAA